MPYIVTSPEGKKFKVTPPAGATPEQINAEIQRITGAGQGKPAAMSTVPEIEAEQRALVQKEIAANKSIGEVREMTPELVGLVAALAGGAAAMRTPKMAFGQTIPNTPGGVAAFQIPVQGLMGAGGEAARQMTALALGLPTAPASAGEAATRIGKAFAADAAMQGGSEIVSAGARKLFQPGRTAMLKPENVEVFRVADKLNLPLSAAEITNGRVQRIIQNFTDSSALGRGPAMARRKDINDRIATALEGVVKKFSTVDAGDTYGMGKALSSATDDARAAWKSVADFKYDEMRKKIPQGITVSLSDAHKKAQDLLGRTAGLAEVLPNFLKDLGPEDEILKRFIGDATTEVKLPSGQTITAVKRISPDQALALRSKLSEKTWEYTRKGDRQAAKLLGDLEKAVDDSLTRQLGNVIPQFKTDLYEARKFYREGADLFHDAVIADLANRDMQRVIEGIGLDQTAKITDLKRAFTTYGKGEEGWQAFRAYYTNEVIRKAGDNPAALKKILDDINPTALDAVYGGGSVRGKEALTTLREISTAAERVDKLKGDGSARMMSSLAMLMWGMAGGHSALTTAGAIGTFGPPVMARIINNPKAARLYVQGWAKAPKDMGAGMMSMVRAINLAVTAKEAKQLADEAKKQAQPAEQQP